MAGRFVGELLAPAWEPHRLGAIAIGPLAPPTWRGGATDAGFYELKGVLEALSAQLGAPLRTVPASEPFLQAGRASAIEVGGRAAGWLGELHPLVARTWDLPGGVAFELDVASLFESASLGRERYEDVITDPAVYQDIAVAVSTDVPAERVSETVIAAGGELLRSARVFDVYGGEQVGPGRKSLALRLEFRAPDRTLTDEEVADRRDAIERALEKIGGSLRG